MKIISKFLLITTLLISNSAYSAITTEDITIEELVVLQNGNIVIFGDKELESAGLCNNTAFLITGGQAGIENNSIRSVNEPLERMYTMLLTAFTEGLKVNLRVEDPALNQICYVSRVSLVN